MFFNLYQFPKSVLPQNPKDTCTATTERVTKTWGMKSWEVGALTRGKVFIEWQQPSCLSITASYRRILRKQKGVS